MAYTVCKEEQRKNRKRGQAEKMKYEHITEGRFIDRPIGLLHMWRSMGRWKRFM